MRSRRTTLRQRRTRLNKALTAATLDDPSGIDSVDIAVELDSINADLDSIDRRVAEKEKLLSKEGRAGKVRLQRLSTSKYLEALVTAAANKGRIRQLLQHRKFELRRVADDHSSHTLSMSFLIMGHHQQS